MIMLVLGGVDIPNNLEHETLHVSRFTIIAFKIKTLFAALVSLLNINTF